MKRPNWFPVLGILAVTMLFLAAIGGCLHTEADTCAAGIVAQQTVTVQPPSHKRQFTLVAVGDIMLDRNVWRAIKQNGSQSILQEVRDLTRSADIAFANLECPLSNEGPHSPSEYLIFRAPPQAAQVLADGGFDIVSLANNHTLNAGRIGVLNTLATLEKYGMNRLIFRQATTYLALWPAQT